jgi:hypothetical protein
MRSTKRSLSRWLGEYRYGFETLLHITPEVAQWEDDALFEDCQAFIPQKARTLNAQPSLNQSNVTKLTATSAQSKLGGTDS